MLKIALVLLFFASVPAFGQEQESVRAEYARNGVLIGLSNLAPLRECPVRAADGKVRYVKVDDGTVIFELRSDEERMTFSFPLDLIDEADRGTFRKQFLRKGVRMRASGYACSGEGRPLEAISVERSY